MKQKIKILTYTVALLVCTLQLDRLASADSESATMVEVNGNFERGLAGWTTSGNVKLEASGIPQGRPSIRIGPGAGFIKQRVAVGSDNHLTISATIHSEAGGHGEFAIRCLDKKGNEVMTLDSPKDIAPDAKEPDKYSVYMKPHPLTADIEVVISNDASGGYVVSNGITLKKSFENDSTLKPTVDLDKYMQPFWVGDTVYSEPVLLYSEDGRAATGHLMFNPRRIISVTDYGSTRQFAEGADYTLRGRELIRTSTSGMTQVRDAEVLKGELNWNEFGGRQVMVTYEHSDKWTGPLPGYMGSRMPHTMQRLAKREPLKVVAYGDSITFGIGVSRMAQIPPYMPSWAELFVNRLKAIYKDNGIRLYNSAQSGATSEWGERMAARMVSSLDPDLVVIAFGQNDFWSIPAETFCQHIAHIIQSVRAAKPNAEFLLVSTMRFDPAYTSKSEYWNLVGQYSQKLKSLTGPGVQVVDMTEISEAIYAAKKPKDCINDPLHPNDYLVRWYAQSLVAALDSGADKKPARVSDGENGKSGPAPILIDASAIPTVPLKLINMGGSSPSGEWIGVNSKYLTRNGAPWFPVMGEFHYSRYPEKYWEEELLKMKAAGVQVVSTYIFWNHHEEIEGQFDWSKQRDLRHFVELCAKHGLLVFVRIGPWAHGEARNGGFPDWLLTKGPNRENNPIYLSYVGSYFHQIGLQLKGLLWKDGGPVMGVQLENEYVKHGPNAGAAHIAMLKKMAIESGLEVPLYTVTGWGGPDYPADEVIPVSGGYPDEFWVDSIADLVDPEGVYIFKVAPVTRNGILQQAGAEAPAQEDSDSARLSRYPRITAEMGGGMQVSYIRRLRIDGNDIAPMLISEVGSGTNLYGYYLFHGGSNPVGKLSTLQESLASRAGGDWSDMPVISYDFQAILGEFGQLNSSYRQTKILHQFLNLFGSELAQMQGVPPATVASGALDTDTPRVVGRFHHERGFIFCNNYLRNHALPMRSNFQLVLKLPSETITVPRNPINIPAQSYFIWPVNLDMNGATLKYATAEPFAKLVDHGVTYFFFAATPANSTEFAFDSKTVTSVESEAGAISRSEGRLYIGPVKPGERAAIRLKTKSGADVRIVVLTQQQAENSWTAKLGAKDYLFFSPSDVFFDGNTIHLRSRNVRDFSFGVFPEIPVLRSSVPVREDGQRGIFKEYVAAVEPKEIPVNLQKIRDAEPAREMDPSARPAAPADAEYERAARWHVQLPSDGMKGVSDLFLDISYLGDVGRLYLGKELIHDNFFNGAPWEIGLKRFAPAAVEQGLDLRILPLGKGAPIYIHKTDATEKYREGLPAEIKQVTAIPEYEVKITMQTTAPK